MTDNEIMFNLLQGLQQLQMNLTLLDKTHAVQGYKTDAPYTVNTANLMKLEYVNKSLEMLQRDSD